MRREQPHINAGSMADIAFLLLIFFLVTATMDYSKGIMRRLQPLNDTIKKNISEVQKRNVLTIFIDNKNNLIIDKRKVKPSEINALIKDFIANPTENKEKSSKIFLSTRKNQELFNKNTEAANEIQRAIDILGNIKTSEGIILLKYDKASNFETYIKVQDIIITAFKELREAMSMQVLNKHIDKLNQEQMLALKTAIPVNIAEPDNN
ncbi:MAG: biopolymer transporter ExbD [Bacteroidales bacterium]|nr:biopolymer transporter ExbD [Bacteroidales bacterium]